MENIRENETFQEQIELVDTHITLSINLLNFCACESLQHNEDTTVQEDIIIEYRAIVNKPEIVRWNVKAPLIVIL